ncbi:MULTISPECIES: DIM/SIM/IMP family subclass B1 metallo-beta-lactamase [Pseudoalteromonas]|uniref:beta-lactamase n=1 Tax=Pseudoalteromonas peptidolytica F12-50-A1 TaxID=1315280 RepID=A0A8I0T6Y3_9GAMM|nr:MULTISPECIES: DIM/SIM/IMP family subclass B1 metallo-beta-lactamase [Pseudoalteromonas]MBE0347689.1 metallo-beta-lactamase class B [Pseudoalteromonas peptidolytica F12-50-A1]NLR16135.1 DIM/SIM/IMP family subclass B1 metallo-beta-lactamase [Pseudoalteromonas peptidolytica]RXE97845.1 DIM/SIM/IMP family subclass B1 metallo-beta-lactamase [Pseudoalteromonas sp. PS5]GEK11686.1 beta-lactamase [Pseudoalteromonas peptidolytica]
MYYLIIITILYSSYTAANEIIPELEIEPVTPGVFIHKSYSQIAGWGLVSANGLIVVEDKKAFIIDTPWSSRDTEKLVDWIHSQKFTLLGSISTHSHDDRAAGIKWLNEHGVSTYATDLTNNLLEKAGKTQATHSIKKNKFVLADGLLEVFYPGGGHTIDNIVVWLPKSKLLFGGCFVRSLQSQSLGYTGEAQIEQWPHSVAAVLSRYPNVEIVVPGHGAIGSIELLKHTKKLANKATKSGG